METLNWISCVPCCSNQTGDLVGAFILWQFIQVWWKLLAIVVGQIAQGQRQACLTKYPRVLFFALGELSKRAPTSSESLCIHTYIHVCMQTYIQIDAFYMYTCIHPSIHTPSHTVTCIHAYVHTYTHTCKFDVFLWIRSWISVMLQWIDCACRPLII